MNKIIKWRWLTGCVALLCVAVSVQARERILLTRYTGNWDGRETTLYIARGDGSGERQLLSTPGYDYAASFSHDRQWVIFTSERMGSADIYRVRTDGSGMERLTDDPAMDDQAALSPDGRTLAFVSTRGKGSADIWVMDMATRRARNLTNGAGGNFRPSWSPDGHWLAFSTDRATAPRSRGGGRFEETHEASVYVMRADGSAVRRLTPDGVYAGSPKWSADGKHIVCYETTADTAFDVAIIRDNIPPPTAGPGSNAGPQGNQANQGGGPNNPGPQGFVSQVFSIDVASGQASALTTGPDFKVAPHFVRDEVAYVVKTGQRKGIRFTRSGEGAAGQLRDASWSDDGSQVVYDKLHTSPLAQNQPLYGKLSAEFELVWSQPFPAVSRSGKVAASTDFGRHTGVSIIRADGSTGPLLSDSEAPGEGIYPSWSADEQWIVYSQGAYFRGGAVAAQLFLVRPDGKDRHAVTNSPGNSAFPSFAPDEHHVVFRYRGQNEQGLRILNLDDGTIRVLTTERDDVPAWSPNGDRIAFTRAVDGSFDIFSIKPDGTDLKRLTDAPGHDAHCSWSPDGKHLLFSSARSGFKDELALYYDWSTQSYTELFVMDADGGNQRPLTDNKWEDGTAVWLPASALP